MSRIRRGLSALRTAAELPRFLRTPLELAGASATIAERMRRREERFLELLRTILLAPVSNPYRALLAWAGQDLPALEQRVRSIGVERTLETLHDSGVYVTLDEFKARQPIERGSLCCPVTLSAFDRGGSTPAIAGATSGSRGPRVPVGYSWPLIEEHATNELLLNALHGVDRLPLVLWMPPLPSIAGMQYALMNLRWRRAPSRWFSPLPASSLPIWSGARFGNAFLRVATRWCGHPLPTPEYIPYQRADQIAAALASHRPALLRTYAGAAVRVAEAAVAARLDLDGCTVFTGGEPLTASRRMTIEASGMRAIPRYSATEAGLIGASCPRRRSADDMHVYDDRLAVIERHGTLYFSSLSPHSGKLLLNTSLGDQAQLDRCSCDCSLGQLGLQTRVRLVRSAPKYTAEGMNLLATEFEAIAEELFSAAGISGEAWQIWEPTAESLVQRIVVVIDPRCGEIDLPRLQQDLLARIARLGPGGGLTAGLWARAGTIELCRAAPVHTAGAKQPRRIERDEASSP